MSIPVYVEVVHIVGLLEATGEVYGEHIYLALYLADIVVYEHLGGGDQVQLELIELEIQTLHLEVFLLQQQKQVQLTILIGVLFLLIIL